MFSDAAVNGDVELLRARKLYEQRRRRDAGLDDYAAFISEEMWDILLGLAIQHHETRPIPALTVPLSIQRDPGEGIRCVAVLRRLGLVERLDRPDAHLLQSIRLSNKGAELMIRALAAG